MNCPGHTQFRHQLVFFVHIYGWLKVVFGIFCLGKTSVLQSDPLNSNSLNSSFFLNSSGEFEHIKNIIIDPMLNYPHIYSPWLVHCKISAYFWDELSGSDCINFQILLSHMYGDINKLC